MDAGVQLFLSHVLGSQVYCADTGLHCDYLFERHPHGKNKCVKNKKLIMLLCIVLNLSILFFFNAEMLLNI